MKEALYQIGSLAEKASVTIQTIRYYERIQLLLPKFRKDSKRTRFYDDESLKILHFIKHAQELGFHLEEIRGLLNLKNKDAGGCFKVKDKFSEKLKSVQLKINHLQTIESNLKLLISECEVGGDGCPIMARIESRSNLETVK